jgi:hypothetical protein
MKFALHSLATAVALAAACSIAGAQTRPAHKSSDVSPYQRNHQTATTGGSMASDAATPNGLREDMEGSAISPEEATRLCDTLSSPARREDCAARVSRDDTSMPAGSDSGMSSGSTMDHAAPMDGGMRRHRRH